MFETSDKTHEVDVRVGYYTSIYGLGRHPSHTKIRSVSCTNETVSPELGSLQNFWRSAENFQTGAHPTYSLNGKGGMLWTVSQAAPLRRAIVDGNMYLWYLRIPPEGVSASDPRYPFQGACLEYPGWVEKGIQDPFGDFASGGFMANVSATGVVSLGSQQQYCLRNCSVSEYQKGSWSVVFIGCESSGSDPGEAVYTEITSTKMVAEKPFVIKEGGQFRLVVPEGKNARRGVDYSVDESEVRCFSNVFVANPSVKAADINRKLQAGRDVVFTPGVYELSETIQVHQ